MFKKQLTRNVLILVAALVPFYVRAESLTPKIIDGSPASEMSYPNVARLSVGGDLVCTGTLVSPNHVLTAAHCFFGENNTRAVRDQDLTLRMGGQIVTSKKVYIHPAYKSRSSACVEGETDAAVVELASPVVGIDPVPLIGSPLPTGSPLLLVGYGTQGSGERGEDGTIPADGVVNVGSTTVEGYGDNPPRQNSNSTYFYWTFDRGEANTASGDSGGPSFYRDNGTTLLAGITCGGDGNSEIGTLSFNTRADLMKSWVDSITGTTPSNTAPGFAPFSIQSASMSTPFSFTVPVTGSSTLNLTASDLPPGLSLSGTTITGIPTIAGSYSVNLVASNPYGSAAAKLVIVVSNYSPSVTIRKVLLQFDDSGDGEDFLDISGTVNVGAKFKPKNKQIVVRIGRFSRTFKLDANGQSLGNPIRYFDLQGPFKGAAFKKAVVKYELTLERVALFRQLSTLGFPTSDEAVGGQIVSLPVSVTVNGVESSTTVNLVFRERDARWHRAN